MTIDHPSQPESTTPESPPATPPVGPEPRVPSGGLHTQRKYVAVAAGFGMLATFLPWINAPIVGSISGTAGDGWITLVVFLVALLLAFGGHRGGPLPRQLALATSALGVVGAAIGIWKIGSLAELSMSASDNPFAEALASAVSPGIGLFLLIGAGCAIPVIVRLTRVRP